MKDILGLAIILFASVALCLGLTAAAVKLAVWRDEREWR